MIPPKPPPVEIDVLQAEKIVKTPLNQADPGKMNFSEAFFDQLHYRIMAQVEKTEILPKAPEKPASLPKKLRLWWENQSESLSPKSATPLMALAIMLLSASLVPSLSNYLKASPKSQDLFISEALKSPEAFENLIASSLGQSDFLVDVASRNFDHLNIHDYDDIFSSTVVVGPRRARSSQETR